MLSQLSRFVRLFAFAAVPALVAWVAGGNTLTVAGAAAVIVPIAETTWRQIYPTVTKAAVRGALATPPPAELP